MPTSSQYDAQGRLRHLLTLQDMPRDTLTRAARPRAALRRRPRRARRACRHRDLHPVLRAVDAHAPELPARGAAARRRRAGLRCVHLVDDQGETALDTLKNIEAMGVRGFVIRHKEDGALASLVAAANPGTTLLNAGDGRSAHPTQGLLDMLTLRQAKGTDFSTLKIAIIGDIKHSRVARSDLHAPRRRCTRPTCTSTRRCSRATPSRAAYPTRSGWSTGWTSRSSSTRCGKPRWSSASCTT